MGNSPASVLISNVGEYEYIFTSQSSVFLGFALRSLGDVSIDNVSVKEYLGQEVVPDSGCGSWLLEPQSTNLITYSEDFSDSSWDLDVSEKNITRTPNAATSPSGENNATKIIGNDTSKNPSQSYIGASTSASAPYASSIFAKKGEYDYLVLGIGTYAGGYYAIFNLSNGTISTSPTASGTTASIEDYGNGWFRCILDTTNTSGSEILFISPSVDGTLTTGYTNTTNGVYIWGAQLEQQSYTTSYIPTNGATNTRLQDIANNSGNSTLINSTEGVLYAEATYENLGAASIISLTDGTNTNRVMIYWNTNDTIILFVRVNGVYVAEYTIPANQVDVSIFNKIALKYKTNDMSFWLNGTKVATDTSGTMFSANTLTKLAFNSGSGGAFYGKVKALAVFKEALTDAQLQSLTTI